MIVFTCLKKEFINYVKDNTISNKVYQAYKDLYKHKTKYNQIKAWANSLPFMKDIIKDLPDNTGISIEYNIPGTSKSIDFIISGYDKDYKPKIIIVELKQWSQVKLIKNIDGVVRTKINNIFKNVLHPAYQILSYTNLLQNYNLNIEKDNIDIIPVCYLHNYNEDNNILYNLKYKPYYSKVNMFFKNDRDGFKDLVDSIIKYGDNLDIIKRIDNSDNKPTKKLIDAINKMIDAHKEFILLDEQKIIMEDILNLVKVAFLDKQKRVIIIKGGPGTGKSILAINALGELLKMGFRGAYVSKNMAPRKVYKNKLVNNNEVSVNELFKSSGYFFKNKENEYDFLLVDEAHRLQEKSGIHNNLGENQIKEIINASKVSIFFIDEKQIITLKDIGKIDNIKYFANYFKALIYNYELNSQFRCNGSNSYLDFIESILENKKTISNFNFDFQVIDSPLELKNLIVKKNTNNNARLVAGFCWPRKVKYADNQNYYDIKIDNLEISWNLKHGEPFAVRLNAINEVGCIYNVQGIDFDYIGVIIGPDLKLENRKVKSDYTKRASTEKSLYGLYVLMKKDKEYYEKVADQIIKNTYRVLLTRGIKGCYVYACDKKLQEYLKKMQKQNLMHL